MNKRFFADKSQHASLLNGLMGFTAKINSDVEQKNDGKGHMIGMVERQSKVNFDLTLICLSHYLRERIWLGLKPKS